MRITALLSAILITAAIACSGAPPKYAQIRLFIPDKASLDRVWASGIDFEGSSGRIGGWMEFFAGPEELRSLSERNVAYSVVTDDAGRSAAAGLSPVPMDALGFGYGSMGGYYTFAEVLQQLDSMRLLYPSLITAKAPIGYSNEGREIWSVKISDNADAEEGRPQVLYTALHHAREPGGMMTVLYYMWYLLEHYGSDPQATYLVNNREMWFVPVVNPDGYVYNQTTNPVGGGFWRKNRRNNGDGTFGIDLNRNYGTFTMWNAPNGGSSTSTGSDTYRGPSPFSEPETQAIDAFMRLHDIRACLNFHTYGQYLIYPWGFLSSESPDSLTYREFAYDMVRTNRHATGTDLQTVNYSTRGNSDDYMFGDVTKPVTFAMTPECGTSFWPPSNQILPIALENLDMNFYASFVAGQYSMLRSYTVADAGADGYLQPGESFTLTADIRNKGLGDAPVLHVALSTNSPDVQFPSPSSAIGDLAERGDTSIAFSGNVSPAAASGSAVQVYVDVTDTSGYAHRDSLTLYIGEGTTLLADGAESGTGNWSTGAGWGTSAAAHTGAASFTDSPAGPYAPNSSNALQSAQAVDLTGYTHAVLRFWTKWTIEPTWDFGLVEVSTNGGLDWTSLRTPVSHTASLKGAQLAGLWGYDGYTPGLNWIFQEIDLTQYVGSHMLLRFRVTSDGGDQRDGMYVDDISITGYLTVGQRSSIHITDHGALSATLEYGESPVATDGIDSLLGESALPGVASPGSFDARWQVPPTNGTTRDIRESIGNPHPTNTFILAFQPGPGGYPFTFGWSGAALPAGGWRLRDGKTSGGLFNLNMWLDTSVTVADTSVHTIEIVHTQTDSFSYSVWDSWNLVSIPMRLADAAKTSLYPGAISNAWGFWGGSGYIQADTIRTERAYWVKFLGGQMISMTGIPIVRDTIVVPSGWAVIAASGVICPQAASDFGCPICSPFYGYNNGYSTSATLSPGHGAFVKGPRTIIFSCFGSGAAAPKNSGTSEFSGLNSLSIGDANGGRTSLYFGPALAVQGSPERYELPPVPPAGLFDARYTTGSYVEAFSNERADAEKRITIQSAHYPISVSWTASGGDHASYELQSLLGDQPVGTQSLGPDGRVTISDPRITSLRLRKVASGAAPSSFRLSQNYPNPFNPSTTISYDIAEDAVVTLKIYNTLGETVSTLVDRAERATGRYSSLFDAGALSSGVYFYTLFATRTSGAGSLQFTQKMLVVK